MSPQESFRSIYRHGLARVAACTTRCTLADPAANAAAILDAARQCHLRGAALAVFPELGISGYAISDLLHQSTLLDAVETAIADIVAASADLPPLLLVGAPLRHAGARTTARWRSIAGACWARCRKCTCRTTASFMNRGTSWWATAWWAAASPSANTPRRSAVIFNARVDDLPGFVVHAEICEDVWIPIPPSSQAALAGATVLANLSASNITIGKAETRRLLCASQSARCVAAYLYAAAGAGESTTDLAWDGQASIFENGATLAETERFPSASQFALADIDLDLLRHERMQMGSFDTNRRRHAVEFRRIGFRVEPPIGDIGVERKVERYPFVPADAARLEQDCYEAYNIQVSGLAQRLRATDIKRVVIGVSGGLDSTQALIVCAHALDLLGLPHSNIFAYTMPGFATSAHTKANAIRLMEALGVTWEELDIRPAAERMLADIHHPYARGEPVYDLTFENVQAGLRTDYLFRLANHHNGIVIGTGDLSELALGWCTYGVGDQMSHYNVNAGVPKTLIQHLIRWVIGSGQFKPDVDVTLDAILATEISPELVPSRDGETPQSTEAAIGPYALQDFNLYLHAAPWDACRRRSHSWRCTPGLTPRRAIGRWASWPNGAAPTTWRRSANG